MSITLTGQWKPKGIIRMRSPEVVATVPTLEWTQLPSFPINLRIGQRHLVSWSTNVTPDQVTYQWRQGVQPQGGTRPLIPEWRNGNKPDFWPSSGGAIDCVVTLRLGDQVLTALSNARGPVGEDGTRVFHDSFESGDVWTLNYGDSNINLWANSVQGSRSRRFDPSGSSNRSDIILANSVSITSGRTYRLRIWARTVLPTTQSVLHTLLWNGSTYETSTLGQQTTTFSLDGQWKALDVFWVATRNSIRPRILSQTTTSPAFMIDNISIHQMN